MIGFKNINNCCILYYIFNYISLKCMPFVWLVFHILLYFLNIIVLFMAAFLFSVVWTIVLSLHFLLGVSGFESPLFAPCWIRHLSVGAQNPISRSILCHVRYHLYWTLPSSSAGAIYQRAVAYIFFYISLLQESLWFES